MEPKSVFLPDILEGKVALLTGGGSGIGLCIATYFGRHGAKVVLMGRRKQVVDEAAKSLGTEGIQAIGVAGDVRKKEDCMNAVQKTVDEFGRLDILVNGAAGNFLSAAEDLSPNAFKTVMEIDALGTYTMSYAALHYLKKGGQGKQPQEGGVIINISATLHYSAQWYQLHVSAAKAAIDSMTRSLALEWGTDFGIRVNGIAPGPIKDTPGVEKLVVNMDGTVTRDIFLGDKSDIAQTALFFCSEGGKYINGATLPVDGGNWIKSTRYYSTEAVRTFSREYEKRRKAALAASSKL
ncbi:2,4-dienoyl-CoA reductase [(3E)-enoyl-CoA-producing], peroxisomal [Marchantia polymorpha subsp. ruderalis]|uniref:2,4-dienoyl-CoA reductase [(3E)-enoyl-CoA-producing] n=2 Tax=Marchantia polymorpha TaxID=3197 RepID=A0A176VKY1_MARPO|nr:hypothetical protein AXG93_517s1190 [Marchantia polymorpha subsp. ruderalis]PTQ37409.1 hypothetical protein MARPO_0057s0046 [Marchantia polymorpha]BBN16433.1 hypothetical protein Mp_7g06250 [Marchantia polymorpha subsp. ruderalis]|eukprot:PTQ37409.1 hypothetical protein MARPO_0057s0046 [Marchantia polymorpha]